MTGTGGGDRVTVVVMTRDRPDDLARSLPHHEAPVVVVDNGSSPPLEPVVARTRPDATYLRLPRNRGAVARNIGVTASRTAFVAFADDDSWWTPGSLARAADVLDRHPRLALLAGRIQVGEDGPTDPVSLQMATAPHGRDPDLPGPNVTGFLACGAVVRRDAFLAAGGFDPVVFFPGEEERLALDLLAAGWGMAYVDSVTACHLPAARDERPDQRAALLARNAVLTAWMRRPLRVALRRSWQTARSGVAGRSGLRGALPRLPAALARRRVVPQWVERQLAGAGDAASPPSAPAATTPTTRPAATSAARRTRRGRRPSRPAGAPTVPDQVDPQLLREEARERG